MCMKKLFLFLLGIVMAVSASAQGRIYGLVIDDNGETPVYKEMKSGSAVVGKLIEGQEVFFMLSGANWYQVSTTPKGEAMGYVPQEHIDIMGASTELNQKPLDFRATGADLNVYERASKGAKVVKKFYKNKHFVGKHTVDVDGWVAVFLDKNVIGYMLSAGITNVSDQ